MTYLFVHGSREYLLSPGDTLESDLGILEVPDDVAPGDTVETHLGDEFAVRALRGPDLFNHFDRTGAPMMPRDVGLLMGHTGASDGDRVLDAGTGTGVLSAYLARAGCDVTTYERDPDFAANARENMRLAGVDDRVDVRTGDLLSELDADGTGDEADGTTDEADGTTDDDGTTDEADGTTDDDGTTDEADGTTDEADGTTDEADGTTDEADGTTDELDDEPFDLLTLDTQDAPAIVERAPDLLVDGGFLAAYVPFVENTRAVVEAARAAGLDDVRTFETIQREMDFDDRGSRPSTTGVGHTGYLVFARK